MKPRLGSRCMHSVAHVLVLAFAVLLTPSTILACAAADGVLQGVLRALQQRDPTSAEGILSQIPADQKDCPSANLARGRLAVVRGNVPAALTALAAYVKAVPNDPSGRLDLAQAQLMAGKTSEARRNANEAANSAKSSLMLLAAGQMLHASGDPAGAERALLKAVELDPSDEQAVFQLGVLYDSRQQHVQAEKAFRRALTLNPQNPQAYDYLALSLAPQGRTKEAEAAFTDGLKFNSGPLFDRFLPYNYARLLAQLNRLSEAVSQLDQAASLAPGTRAILYERAKALHRMGRQDTARADAEHALKLEDPGKVVVDSQIYYLLVRICGELGDQAAVRRYAELARTAPAARNTAGR